MIMQSQYGAPYATKYQEWFKYEFVSSTPDSPLTAVRQQASIKWGIDDSTKPWVVWRVLEKWEVADIKAANRSLEYWIDNVPEYWNSGPPFTNPALPEKPPVTPDAIDDATMNYVRPSTQE